MAEFPVNALAGAETFAPRTDLRRLADTVTPPLAAAPPSASGRDLWLSAWVALAALGYATLRYNVFKGVPWDDWPSYTLNKALAVASLLLIAAAAIRLRRRGARTGTLLAAAGGLALAHSLLSFALFDPLYFPRLFAQGKLSFVAGASITLGVAAMAAMDLGARRSALWSPGLRHQALAWIALTSGVHAALPALSTWVEPATWPGGMPPLTLISFLAGLTAIAAWLGRSSDAYSLSSPHQD